MTKIIKNGYNMINDYGDNNYECIYSCVATVSLIRCLKHLTCTDMRYIRHMQAVKIDLL